VGACVRILWEAASLRISVAKLGQAGMLPGMDWQETTALLIVAATVGVFAWRRFRPRKFSFKRDSHCGCSPSASNQPPSSVVFHARKGGHPRMTVKMN